MSGSSEASSDFLFLSYICCVHQQACVDRTSEGKLWFPIERWLLILIKLKILEISNLVIIPWAWNSHCECTDVIFCCWLSLPKLFFVQKKLDHLDFVIKKTENIYLFIVQEIIKRNVNKFEVSKLYRHQGVSS